MAKKFFLFLLLMVMLAGCASKVPAPTAIAPPVEVVPTQREGTFYFLAANNADQFYVPGVKGLTDAGNLVGMKTEFVGPMDLSVTSQMKTFEELIASPTTKGILWYAIDFNAGQPLVEEAMAKGIPVIIGGGDSPYKTRNAFVGYDNAILGTQAAIWANKLIGCNGTVGTIAVTGINLDLRTQSFNNYFKETCKDKIKIVERATTDGSAANEAAVLEAYMVANPDLTLLWWADGGAGRQVQTWKEKQAQGIKTIFLATDMPPATLQAVKDGIFAGSVGQDTYTEEFIAVIMLDLLSKGYRIPDTLYLSAILVDKNNVDLYLGK